MNKMVDQSVTEKPLDFNYAVGRHWDKSKPNGPIGFYAYGSDIFYGTLSDAKAFRDYCNKTIDDADIEKRGYYKIYKLVELPE